MTYNRSEIMKSAWQIRRVTNREMVSFSECLKRAWAAAKFQASKPADTVATRFENNMSVTADGYTRTLVRWTKGDHDRVYINGGSRSGDGWVDLKKGVAQLNGELTYQCKIAEMVLAMQF